MKKINTLLMCIVTMLFIIISSNMTSNTAYAAESTASLKGFNTNNLTYLDDKTTEALKIETDKWYYGSYGLWTACYKYVVTESNGSKTCYYFALIESYINSYGKNGKRYFRNKQLLINTRFEYRTAIGDEPILVIYQPESSDATTSNTSLFGVGADGSCGTTTGVNFTASLQMTKTTTYSAVNLVCSDKTNEAELQTKKFEFKYLFANWEDGSMKAPNIGMVKERMFVVYGVSNYTGSDAFNLIITAKATIFKDATWPLTDATLSGEVSHKYISGMIN